MKIIQITPEHEMMSNTYLVMDEKTNEAALVDPGCYLENAKNAIKENNADVKYSLLTHGHFDHILGAPYAKKDIGAKIVIHKEEEECLSSERANLMIRFNITAPFVPTKADMYIEEGDVIELGETRLQVMHTPGHSKGGVCFINHKDRVVLSGDTLFYSTVGRTDAYGGSDEELQNSLLRLLALEGDYNVFPGHGPKTTLSHERVRNIYVRRMNRE